MAASKTTAAKVTRLRNLVAEAAETKNRDKVLVVKVGTTDLQGFAGQKVDRRIGRLVSADKRANGREGTVKDLTAEAIGSARWLKTSKAANVAGLPARDVFPA